MAHERDKKENKIPLSRILVILLACAVFAYSGFQLFSYWNEDHQSQAEQQELIDQAVVVITPTETSDSTETKADTAQETEAEGEETEPLPELVESPPIFVDFETLQQDNENIVAWLYCEGTVINYPVVQGEDNLYYVDRLPDGRYNPHGSIFMDFRNLPDFSDFNTIFYGHNMANDTMFGTLHNYNSQAYYERHPYMWIITADAAYRLDLFAGLVTASDSNAYQLFNSREELHEHLEYALSQSVFDAGEVDISKMEHVVTLSTCSYEFATARFILIGNLVPAEYPVNPEATQPSEP